MQPDAAIRAEPAPATRALTCPSCGGGVELRAAGYTVHVACQYCGSILDVTDPQVKLVTAYHQAAAALEIPLGTRGVLRGVEWEVIGYLQRSENGAYGWDEYLLFNPYHGYRWLVYARGGWSLGEQLTVMPDWVAHDQLAVAGEIFTHFYADGVARVDYVLGEFFWRVAVGETVQTADWARPGAMLSREENAQEISWTRNEWLPSKEMQQAFGVQRDPLPWPPLPHQPSPWGDWLKTGVKIGLVAFAFLLLFAFQFGGTRWDAAGTFPIAADGREQSVTLGPITLRSRYQSVHLRAEVPRLENGWLDLDYSLVDRKTQQVYEAYGAAERYSGTDSDGAWTEGDRRTAVSIPSVPAGSYDLVVDYKGNRWSNAPSYLDSGAGWMDAANAPQVTVEVRQGAVYASNLWLALILIAAPLLFGLFRHLSFESARKGESDFAPSGSDGDDDE
ncbi:hypothetical protein FHS95_000861 [Sphingomonas naasensis]|uniref:DUF4178 domain-containing protein n=1 Tax=Sphingomonas naasensis TaxID=1344951 RepID=A0A4S1WVE9_9SPHN|nr:DUF4178 domain-containing protein [Sphingomonas naasensis]NIJ19192.1 hypothetical protein [Sphingomonas naasensis]TGX46377.1 DUF4178 domain-containing protein [Sphingomonas naasensis]